ncbi:Fic family protein [Levilactobacillus fujinensis]|uniref:Fic family protein n=1 Tax=Levilactobacillus fujinensis TaxID=2486024 RepID=A0ABW1TGM5_9LACO|nr:Fic family protein [Levilactobacillus fujinensis]
MSKRDNTALARFITSLGSLNDYGSTVAQTKQALDLKSSQPLNQSGEDIAIFQDALGGIAAVKQTGFSVAGIIAINCAFTTPSVEQPTLPGHLRNGFYNADDRIAITIDSRARLSYFPPEVVTQANLQTIVTAFQESKQDEVAAWRVFADLAKLQPFQDGNKRTALIAANAAANTWAHENYLVLPFNDLDRVDFTTALMRYYLATDKSASQLAFDRMMAVLPSNREQQLHRPISSTEDARPQQVRIKPMLRKG